MTDEQKTCGICGGSYSIRPFAYETCSKDCAGVARIVEAMEEVKDAIRTHTENLSATFVNEIRSASRMR